MIFSSEVETMQKFFPRVFFHAAFGGQSRSYSSIHGLSRSRCLLSSARHSSANSRSANSNGASRRVLNEPQLVAELIEHFPQGKRSVAAGKWTCTIPEHVQEVLTQYGGLIKFVRAQSNFFTIGKENGLNVIGLSTMAQRLQQQQCLVKEREQKESEKLITRAKRVTVQQIQ